MPPNCELMTRNFIFSFIGTILFLNANSQIILQLEDKPHEVMGRNFNIIDVIDARPDTTFIGIFSTGFSGSRKEKVVLIPSLSQGLKEYIRKSFIMLPTQNSIIIQINQLTLDEYTTYHNGKRVHATLKAHLSFFKKDNGDYYKIGETDYAFDKKGLGGKGKHLKNISELIDRVIQDRIDKGLGINEDQRISGENPYSKQSPVILQADQLKRGVYMTFNDFKRNEPSFEDIEIKSSPDSTFSLFYSNNDGIRTEVTANTKVWGFCDGKVAYLKQHGYYFDLNIQPDNVSFVGFDYVSLMRKKMVGPTLRFAVISGFTGGLANFATANVKSIAILSVIRATNDVIPKAIFDLERIQAMRTINKDIHVYHVSMDSGEFIQQD